MESQRFDISRIRSKKSEQTAEQPVGENKLAVEQASTDGKESSDDELSFDDEQSDDDEQYFDDEQSDDEEQSSDEKIVQQTREEQLALVVQEEEVDSEGEDCELHVYERRYDTRGEEVFLRAGTKSSFTPPKRKSHRACLVLNRHFDRRGMYLYTKLGVQSRHIIKALRQVIGTYHGVDFTTKPVEIREPPRCLFHYRDELRQHAEASEDLELKSHMQLCLEYIEKTLHQEIKVFKGFMSSVPLSPELEHGHLWMIFKPGCLVYEKEDGIERLTRLRSIRATQEDDSYQVELWELSTELIGCGGTDIGVIEHYIEVEKYDGCRALCELAAVPLQFHPEKERIRRDLLERGRKFLLHCGIHHRFYDGKADMRTGNIQFRDVRHRIMLDPEQCLTLMNIYVSFIFGTRIYHSGTEAISDLSDEEIMTCDYLLPGYSLELKAAGFFKIANITEVAYNDNAFQGLILPEIHKKLISSLLQRQDHQQDDEFDDLIRGKGKGLIFLLHGPPGVGKTYTAESIADLTRRPLLRVTSAELGIAGFLAEKLLADVLKLATRWTGITLLDEADVFMQARTLQSLARNEMVSLLLRVLEYYKGILFLTTNRVETIDHAFKSRIHLSIAYPPLSTDTRRELWSNSILRANRGQTPSWLTTAFLDALSSKKVNGREIKNIVRVGHALARSEKRDMQNTDLLQGLDSLEQFDIDFGKLSERNKAEDIKALDDAGQGSSDKV